MDVKSLEKAMEAREHCRRGIPSYDLMDRLCDCHEVEKGGRCTCSCSEGGGCGCTCPGCLRARGTMSEEAISESILRNVRAFAKRNEARAGG